jgi:Fic family protein
MQNVQYIWQVPSWTDCLGWDATRLLRRIGQTRRRQGALLGKAASLGLDIGCEAQASVLSDVRADILTQEALATSEIEDEGLDAAAVRAAVLKHLGVQSADTPAVERHVDGLVEMLVDATVRYSTPLDVERLHGWQAALFPSGYSGLKRIAVGEWRRLRDPQIVVPSASGAPRTCFEAPPSEKIGEEMQCFLRWWSHSQASMEGLLRAGLAHFWFLTIHPFDDGSGRIARALTNMALAQDERSEIRLYSLSSQIACDRDGYSQMLEDAQRGDGELTAWLAWFLDCLERAMEQAECRLEHVLARTRFWQRHGGAALNERQLKVLGVLLDAGPEGISGGLCTRKYVRMTQASRATAQREIANMVRQGLLVRRPAGGRSTCYDAAWG